ncbi:hypothetical protein [Streptomyces nigrescens]
MAACRCRSCSEPNAPQATDDALDAYLNFAYRSAKGHRDGFPVSAHLDAASADGDVGVPRALFAHVERAALAAGHRGILHSWGRSGAASA